MTTIYLGKDDYDKLDYYEPEGEHSESILYLDKQRKLLYKFLISEYSEERKKVVEFLSSYRNKYCSLPIDILFDKDTNLFIGYTQSFLEDYSLGSRFIAKHNSFHNLQELAFRLCTIFEGFLRDGITYLDLHIDNILVHPENTRKIKIIDMDSIFLKKDLGSEQDYAEEVIRIQMLVSEVALAFVLNEDLQELLACDEHMNDLLTEALKPLGRNSTLEEIIHFTFHDPYKIITPKHLIESLKESDVEAAKENIYRLKKQMNI